MLVIEQAEFRRLMSVRPALADIDLRRARRAARDPALGRGRAGDPDHRLALLARGDEPARVRRALASRAHVDRPRGRRGRRGAARARMGLRPQDTPVVITPTGILRRATPASFAEHLGLTFQPKPGYIFDLVVVGSGPAGLAAAVYGASEGLQHRLPGRRHHRRSGRLELAHRELRRLPQRHLRRRPHLQSRRAGDATRRATERAVRGRGAARRGELPRGRPQRRQRDPHARGDRRLRRALPTPGRRGSGALRGRRRLLRGHRPRGARLRRRARRGDRRRQLRRTGRDLPRRRTTAASRSRSAATTSRRRCPTI